MFYNLQKLFCRAVTNVPGFMTLVYAKGKYSIFHSCSDLTGQEIGWAKCLISVPCKPLWESRDERSEMIKALGKQAANDYFAWAAGEQCLASIQNMKLYNAMLHRKMLRHYETELRGIAHAWAEDIYIDIISGECCGPVGVKLKCSS